MGKRPIRSLISMPWYEANGEYSCQGDELRWIIVTWVVHTVSVWIKSKSELAHMPNMLAISCNSSRNCFGLVSLFLNKEILWAIKGCLDTSESISAAAGKMREAKVKKGRNLKVRNCFLLLLGKLRREGNRNGLCVICDALFHPDHTVVFDMR